MYQYFMIQWRQRYIEYRLPVFQWFDLCMQWKLLNCLEPIKFVCTLKGERCTGPFHGAGVRMGSFFPLQEKNKFIKNS